MEVMVNIGAVLSNLTRNRTNRTPMYRAELHVKAHQLKSKQQQQQQQQQQSGGATSGALGGALGQKSQSYNALPRRALSPPPAAASGDNEYSLRGATPLPKVNRDFLEWQE